MSGGKDGHRLLDFGQGLPHFSPMQYLETGSRKHALKGHAKLSKEDVIEGLYEIFAAFSASKSFSKLAGRAKTIGDWQTREEAYIQKRMVYVAIRLRLLDEIVRKSNPGSSPTLLAGSLDNNYGLQTSATSPLTLREACNKIVHADLLNWNRFRNRSAKRASLAPFIHVYGKNRTVRWRCIIDVVEFVKSGFSLIDQL